MADKVEFKQTDMENLVLELGNVATILSNLCDQIEPPVKALTSDELIEGPATEQYKDMFNQIDKAAKDADKICEALKQVIGNIAHKMNLAMTTVTKSAEQSAADMQKIAQKVKESASAQA